MAVDRRALLSTSGLGVAAVGAAALTSAASSNAAATARAGVPGGTARGATAGVDAAVTHSMVAFVSDVRGSEVSLMVGEDEVVVRDEALVARLLAAAAR